MVAVRSTRYPQLLVADLDVKFVNGVAEVTDKKTLEALAGVEGVEVPESPPLTAAEKAKAKKEAEAEKAALVEWLAAEAQWTSDQAEAKSDEK